jgi:hypothetical protein
VRILYFDLLAFNPAVILIASLSLNNVSGRNGNLWEYYGRGDSRGVKKRFSG